MTIRNVLVVEDEEDLRMMTRFMFQSRTQFRVLEASSGEEALALIEREPIDVMLLDLRLPDMEGWDVLSRLEESGRFPSLPVIMVSAHSTPTTATRAQERGVRGYVRKPFTAEELLDQVKRALGEETD
jgi:CheY-like chemotaxis protein